MIGLALDILAFLFLAGVAFVALGLLTLLPQGWRIAVASAGGLVLFVIYLASPGVLAGLAALAGMFGLAALICTGLDRLAGRHSDHGDEPH